MAGERACRRSPASYWPVDPRRPLTITKRGWINSSGTRLKASNARPDTIMREVSQALATSAKCVRRASLGFQEE